MTSLPSSEKTSGVSRSERTMSARHSDNRSGVSDVCKTCSVFETSSPKCSQDYTIRLTKEHNLNFVIGVDECGAGCLSGPLTVCACYLPPGFTERSLLKGLNDSKKLSLSRREKWFTALTTDPEVKFSLVHLDHDTIDNINIFQARMLGMYQAFQELIKCHHVDGVLIDGNRIPEQFKKPDHQSLWIEAFVNGDGQHACIAAASIIAKVTRDRMMCDLDTKYPGYHWSKNKGYPTPDHLAALKLLGRCAIHRMSFRPVTQCDKINTYHHANTTTNTTNHNLNV